MLYSIHSDETGSVDKRKSSLLSYLRKSHSKGSIKSRKSSFAVNKSPPCQRRASIPQMNLPMTDGAVTNHEEIVTTKENILSNLITSHSQRQTTPTKPNFARKRYSHPSDLSPTTRVRYKRSIFLRRQKAVDEEFEGNLSKSINNPSPKGQTSHPGILLNNFNKRY